jgi:E1A/CREB-binding protein
MIGYTKVHIWSCPPLDSNDYIFYCHPPDQEIPIAKCLIVWYKNMLDKGVAENIIIQYKDMYKQAVEYKLQSAAELPYFEGDFWPKVMEGIICYKGKDEEHLAAEESEEEFTEMTSEGIEQQQKKQKWSAVL